MQRRSRWIHCSSSQRAWIEALQHVHFAHYGASSSGVSPHPDTMLFRPPHPSLPRFSQVVNNSSGTNTPILPTPEPQPYYLRPVFFWLPDLYFAASVIQMPCSHLSCALPTMRVGWPASGPLYVHDLQGGHYLNYSMHHCRKHGTFASIHPISMSKLPPYVRDSFPYVLMDASGVTKNMMEFICRAPMLHLSFSDLEASLNHMRYTQYYESMLQYLQQCAHYQQQGRQPHGWTPLQFSTSMTDPHGYNERPAPSAEWLERIYISYTSNLLPFYERRLRSLHDPSYTVARNVKAAQKIIGDDDDPASPNPSHPFSRITAVLGNTTGQLLALRFIPEGKDIEEQSIVDGLQKRFAIMQKEGREEHLHVNGDGTVTITSTSSSAPVATTPSADAVALHTSFDHLGVLFPTPCDTSMAHALSLQWAYEWNVDRHIKLQRQQDYGTVNHWLLDTINQMAERVHGQVIFPDVNFPHADSDELFGVAPISAQTKAAYAAAISPHLFDPEDDDNDDVDAAQIIGAAGAFDAEALAMINQIIENVAKDITVLPGEQPHNDHHLITHKRKAVDDGSQVSKRYRTADGSASSVPWNSSEFAIMITLATNPATNAFFTSHHFDAAARVWNAVIYQLRDHQPHAKPGQDGSAPNPIAARIFQVLQLRDKTPEQIGYAYRKICDIVHKGNQNNLSPTVTSAVATSFSSALPTAAATPVIELANPPVEDDQMRDENNGDEDDDDGDEDEEMVYHTIATNPYLQSATSSTSSAAAPIAYDTKSSLGIKFSDDEENLFTQLVERCREKKDRFKEMTMMWRAEYYASYAAVAQAQAQGNQVKRRDILPRSRQQLKSKHESQRRKEERHGRGDMPDTITSSVPLPVVSPPPMLPTFVQPQAQQQQQQQPQQTQETEDDESKGRRGRKARTEAPMPTAMAAAAAANAAAIAGANYHINPHPLLPDELEPRTGPVDVPSNRPAKHWTEVEAQYFLNAIRENPSKHGNANLSVILTQWNYDRVHHPEKGLGPVSYRQLKAKVQQLKRAKRTVGLNIVGHSDKHRVQQQQQLLLQQQQQQQQQLLAQQQYQAHLLQQHAFAQGGGVVPAGMEAPQFIHGPNTHYIIVAAPGTQPGAPGGPVQVQVPPGTMPPLPILPGQPGQPGQVILVPGQPPQTVQVPGQPPVQLQPVVQPVPAPATTAPVTAPATTPAPAPAPAPAPTPAS